MKKHTTLILCIAVISMLWSNVLASDTLQVDVVLQPPATRFRMGDTPVFKGIITNTGAEPLEGLTVYLSLICLDSGNEHPVDLEDWSAQKAVRVAKLAPGKKNEQEWGMRLIAPGQYAVALTVVGKKAAKPVISDLVKFEIKTKPLISSARILPIAFGEPLLLLIIIFIVRFARILPAQLSRFL
jgi:hypothetical protein